MPFYQLQLTLEDTELVHQVYESDVDATAVIDAQKFLGTFSDGVVGTVTRLVVCDFQPPRIGEDGIFPSSRTRVIYDSKVVEKGKKFLERYMGRESTATRT